MAKQILDWKVQRFTNVNGSTNSNPTFIPFDFQSYGTTNTLRCIIDVDCVALSSLDTTSVYPIQYSAKVVFTWDPSVHGTIVQKLYEYSVNGTDLTWTTDAGGTIGGHVGNYRVQMHAFNSSVFSVCCAARIVSFVEY